MSTILAIFRRELGGYFSTLIAYIIIAVFLALCGIFTFSLGGFYEARQADLASFFAWHPWLYLFLIPAVSMRLWAEERKSGTIELLFTLPVSLAQAVIGKFLAAWILVGVALLLTFPIIITVGVLGDPDFGVIAAGYLGSFLMAGAYLAIGCCVSAATKNQVISFVITVVICFFFLLASFPMVMDLFASLPPIVGEAISGLSFSTHYVSIQRGVVEFKDAVFFVSLILGFLYATALVLEFKKAE